MFRVTWALETSASVAIDRNTVENYFVLVKLQAVVLQERWMHLTVQIDGRYYAKIWVAHLA